MNTEQPFHTSEVLRTALSPVASTKTMSAGQRLFARGEPARGVFLVRSGKVKVWVEDERAAKEAGPGSALGLPATMADIPYILNARVAADAELEFVSREQFMCAFESTPDLRLEVVQILGSEVQIANNAALQQVAAKRLEQARQLLAELKTEYERLPRNCRKLVQEHFRTRSREHTAVVH